MHLLVFCSFICTTSVRLTLSRSFGGSNLGGSLSGTLSRLGLFGLLSLLLLLFVLLLFSLILLAEKGTEQASPLTRLRAALGGLVLDLLILLSRGSLVLLGLLLLVILFGLFLSLFLVFGGLLGSRSGGGRVG